MSSTQTVYEHPLNERLRFFLRLEFLFNQARHSMRGESRWDSHNSVASLLEILNIISRIDIKTEVIKELDRINATLTALSQTPNINHKTLEQLLTTLNGFKTQLYTIDGPLAQEVRENDLIKLLTQRSSIPGGLCDFDLPAYRYWLAQNPVERVNELREWLNKLDSLRLSVELMLKLIRESAESVSRVAENGNYQQTLDTAIPFQLIRVLLPADAPYFVEISAGRHRFTARFMEVSKTARPRQASSNVEFRLSCCAL